MGAFRNLSAAGFVGALRDFSVAGFVRALRNFSLVGQELNLGLQQSLFVHVGHASREKLGRLDDEGVSGGDGHGVHPEGDHSGEVVGSNTSADTEEGSVRSDIDILGNVGVVLPLIYTIIY